MPLFEVAVIERPTKKEMEEGKGEVLILPPTVILARDRATAVVKVMVKHNIDIDKETTEVLVRPFA